MRDALARAANGTAPAAGEPAIGVMPDLQKLITNVVNSYIVQPPASGTTQIAAYFDPGHGGNADHGGSTAYGARGARGTLEKHVNLSLAQRARAHFGPRSALTREGDHNLSLAARLEASRRSGAPVFVAIHSNQGAPSQRGSEVWVYGGAQPASQNSLELANAIRRELEAIGGQSVPVRSAELAPLHPRYHGNGVAACLVEADYLSHPAGEARLTDPAAVDALGAAIARGVRGYIGSRAEGARGQARR